MRKIILSAAILISLNCVAQKKKDTSNVSHLSSLQNKSVDTTKAPTSYFLVMPTQMWNDLLGIINTADRSDQTKELWIERIKSNIRPVPEQPKTSK